MTPFNAADRKSIRAAEKAADRAERERGEVLIALASTGSGRKFLWEELEKAHLFSTPYPADPHQAYFLLGQRNQGQQLFDELIRWCPDQFLQMVREANQRRTVIDGNKDKSQVVDEEGSETVSEVEEAA